jgi:hypothetical protein
MLAASEEEQKTRMLVVNTRFLPLMSPNEPPKRIGRDGNRAYALTTHGIGLPLIARSD